MHLNFKATSLIVASFLLAGCGGGGTTTNTDPTPTTPEPTIPTTQKITITDDYQVESLGSESTISAIVSLGANPKNLYLILSNNAVTSASASITHNAKVLDSAQFKALEPTADIAKQRRILHAPQHIQEFISQVGTYYAKAKISQDQAKIISVPQRREELVDGTQKIFYLDIDGTGSTLATIRKVTSNVNTNFGPKTLNIWVSNDSFDSGSGCSKSKCVKPFMVDQLAEMFLKTNLDNDIYDWVTNIYGEEWGSDAQTKYSNLISEDNEITILLTDIDADNSANGGVVGFFHAKDNFDKTSLSGSNERVMFYIDSVMFANEEGESWQIDDFWPKELVSTLAHEFQHMIHFYQKSTLLLLANSAGTDVWINEMLSESTEDLIASKIRHIGPRGVDYLDGSAGEVDNPYGRYPLFNTKNTLSLTTWSSRLEDYSKVNAFGAYLIRNYSGAQVLHDIMHNTHIDEQAVVTAVNKSVAGSDKTFANLLSEWGTAVLLSDHDNLMGVPVYNTGDFTYSTINDTTFELGSINFFNYNPLPTYHTTAGTIETQGNYYYKIGENLRGDVTIDLTLNGQTEVTLIAK